MKTVLGLGIVALALSGCTAGTCDTGDSACKGTGTTDGPIVQEIQWDLGDTTVIWSARTTGESGLLELDLAETGDTSGGCLSYPNCENGFWTEHHDAFQLVSSEGGEEWKEIVLESLWAGLTTQEDPDLGDYVQNSTTLLDPGVAEIEAQLSYQISAYDTAGNYFDCLAGGHDPTYWGCPNTIN